MHLTGKGDDRGRDKELRPRAHVVLASVSCRLGNFRRGRKSGATGSAAVRRANRGHHPLGTKADKIERRPTGRRVRSLLALSCKCRGIRPAYVIQPAPFGPGETWPYTTIGRVFTCSATCDVSGSLGIVRPFSCVRMKVVPSIAGFACWLLSP
jgi:hypothetical protein